MSTGSETAAVVARVLALERWLGEGEGRQHVLRGVSLDFRRGELAAVVGPSGCGKSTLLYLLGLLDRPDGGEVELEGRSLGRAGDPERTAERNARIGFVFQFHCLLPEFSALENVVLPMRRRACWSVAEERERARGLLAAVGLAGKEGRRPGQLSGGEQQRVAIARALANDPALVLADEPTGNLDGANSGRVFDLLESLARERGPAIVVVTHNPDLAARCHRTYRLRDGQLEGA